MDINTQTITGLGTMVSSGFEEGAAARLTASLWPAVSSTIPTNGRLTEFPFRDTRRRIRKWETGPRTATEQRVEKAKILTTKWQGTAEIEREDVEYDNLGVLAQDARDFGEEMVEFFAEQVFGMLFEPFQSTDAIHLGYDGLSFFNDTHPNNGTPQSNIHGSTAAVEPMWILMNTRKLRSIIMTEHTNFQLVQKFSMTDDHAFYHDKFVWGVRALLGFGYGKWWSAIASRVALDSAAFNAAVNQAANWVDGSGAPRDQIFDTIVSTPDNREAIVEILRAERNASGATNIDRPEIGMHGVTNAIITPYLKARPDDIKHEITANV